VDIRGRQNADQERRQLTVMFVDLVGSTELSQELDPEEFHELINEYHDLCISKVQPYDGYVAQYLGDGVLVYFGYPYAHEDDAIRAVRAGLALVDGMRELSLPEKLKRPIKIRIGIHTGVVMVGEVGKGEKLERLAVGEAPNIAAKIQKMAEPGEISISDSTYKIVEGFFECERGFKFEKGGTSRLSWVYRVVDPVSGVTRFDASTRKGLTPIVGREKELKILLDCRAELEEGNGSQVLISGEAGIGKSRLVHEFKEAVKGDKFTLLECQCLLDYQNSPLYPVVNLMERLIDFGEKDSDVVRLKKLEKSLSGYGFNLVEAVPLLAPLFSLSLPEGYKPLGLSPEKHRSRMLQVISDLIIKISQKDYLIFILEDLHWIDPTTKDFLEVFAENIPSNRIMSVLTFRAGYKPPPNSEAASKVIELKRLGYHDCELIVERISKGKLSDKSIVDELILKSDGIPLYLEELTKTFSENIRNQDETGTNVLPIPMTLHDSLMARLDKLSSAKEIAQIGSAIGREFAFDLMSKVAVLEEGHLREEISRLVDAELLTESNDSYVFNHALIQETAYSSIIKSKRVTYHGRIASALERDFKNIAESQPELLAHHFTASNQTERAIEYWRRAGERANKLFNNQEACNNFNRALNLLNRIKPSQERNHRELIILLEKIKSIELLVGHAAKELSGIYERVNELLELENPSPPVFYALCGMVRFYGVKGKLRLALKVSDRQRSVAEELRNDGFRSLSYFYSGAVLLPMGNLRIARRNFDQAISLYNEERDKDLFYLSGDDPLIGSIGMGSWADWYLGYPEKAMINVKKSLELSYRNNNFYYVCAAATAAAMLCLKTGDYEGLHRYTAEAESLARKQGFGIFLQFCGVLSGYFLSRKGEVRKGIRKIKIGINGLTEKGWVLRIPFFMSLLADAYLMNRNTRSGLTLLRKAISLGAKTHQRLNESELYRLKGEFMILDSGMDSREAEGYFSTAIDIASKQESKSLELRAVMSLCRLWQRQGKEKRARKRLEKTYNWFTEGFDTKNLMDAKALMEELS
jgi:class 3 adenylate cyclase/tetratricopeptide (TPR) repeat protein